MAEEETAVDKKDGTERRVYNLPASLLSRLRAYQVSQSISSEAEAARRLLDYALQMRDTVFNILQTLDARFAEEKDLRVLAGDVLTKHTLVTNVSFEDSSIIFTLRNRERGQIRDDGTLFYQESDDSDDYWRPYLKVRGKFPGQGVAPKGAPSWERPGGSDLDDEIPF